MRDWAIDYILSVLDQRDWSATRLATEAGVAVSTIARPLREKDWPHKLSRDTIRKIHEASGVDPAPFIPTEMSEDRALFAARKPPKTNAARVLEGLGTLAETTAPNALTRNEIKFAVVGDLVQIVATVDKSGLARLRSKLDAIESLLDD